MTCNVALYVGNSNVVELQALTNSVTDVVDTGATVTCTIYDSSGTEVTGQSWPAAMAHDAAGTYRATLDDDIAIIADRAYTVHVDATGTGAEVGHWEVTITAQTRKTS